MSTPIHPALSINPDARVRIHMAPMHDSPQYLSLQEKYKDYSWKSLYTNPNYNDGYKLNIDKSKGISSKQKRLIEEYNKKIDEVTYSVLDIFSPCHYKPYTNDSCYILQAIPDVVDHIQDYYDSGLQEYYCSSMAITDILRTLYDFSSTIEYSTRPTLDTSNKRIQKSYSSYSSLLNSYLKEDVSQLIHLYYESIQPLVTVVNRYFYIQFITSFELQDMHASLSSSSGIQKSLSNSSSTFLPVNILDYIPIFLYNVDASGSHILVQLLSLLHQTNNRAEALLFVKHVNNYLYNQYTPLESSLISEETDSSRDALADRTVCLKMLVSLYYKTLYTICQKKEVASSVQVYYPVLLLVL